MGNLLALKLDMEAPKPELALEFDREAAPPPERVTVTLEMDADLLAWLKEQPLGWQREINNAARFIIDMSGQPAPPIEVYEADFETAGPDMTRDADRIDNEFIPG